MFLATAVAVLIAGLEPRVEAVVSAMNEPGCPRLFGLLNPEFQKAVPAEKWAGFCANVAPLTDFVAAGTKDNCSLFKGKAKPGPSTLQLAFDDKGKVAGLRVMNDMGKKPTPAASGTLPASASFDVQLESIRQKYGLPGMAALVFREGKGELGAAVGVRKLGDDTRVTVQDKWHLGSDTKAMTATLAAMAVEEGKLKWGSTVSEVLKGWKEIDPGYGQITLEMLLGHRGGLPANLSNEGWKKAYNPKDAAKEREAVVRLLLKAAPTKPGEFLYSNAGYMVAGVMIERALGMPWEAAMKNRLFAPLDMGTCGFGPAAEKDSVNQPWAHKLEGEALTPVASGTPGSDNPHGLGPAGTVHCSLSDWMKFVQLHLDGARGLKTPLLKPESFTKLHTAAEGGPYALGWGVADRQWAGGKALTHNGSNGMNFATVWVAPAKGLAFLIATNAGHDAAEQASNEAAQLIAEHYAQ